MNIWKYLHMPGIPQGAYIRGASYIRDKTVTTIIINKVTIIIDKTRYEECAQGWYLWHEYAIIQYDNVMD